MPAAHPELAIRRLGAPVGAGRTRYDTHPSPAEGAARDTAPRDASERLVPGFPGSGCRRGTKALQRDRWELNPKRVRRVLRQEALPCQLRRRCVVTTDSAHGRRTYPNPRAAATLTGPDQARVADLTCIRLPPTFAGLARLLDAWSRRGAGWHLARSSDPPPRRAALDHALAARQPPPGLIPHSDRGVQYAGAASVARLTAANAQASVAAVGTPYENATAESFSRTLKREEGHRNHDPTVQEAEANLGRFIADVDNAKRLHSGLGYLPPSEFEAIHAATVRS